MNERYASMVEEEAPLPWKQGRAAHTGNSVYDANGRFLFTIHGDERLAVAMVALIVTMMNEKVMP